MVNAADDNAKRDGEQSILRDDVWLFVVDHRLGKRNSAAIGNSGNVIYVNVLPRIVIAAAHSFKPAIYDWVDFIWEHIEPFVLEQREKIDAQKGKYSRFYKKCVDNAVCFRYNNKADLRDSTMARWSSG